MRTSRPIAAVLLASLLTALPTLAQPTGSGQPARQMQPVSPFVPQNDLPLVTFTFDGGTLRQYVDAVKKQSEGIELNVGFRGEAERIQMPGIAMKGVSVGTAMQAMSTLADPGAGRYVSVVPVQERNGAPLYSVEIRSMAAQAPFMADQTLTKVFSLRELIRASGSDQGSAQQTAELVLSVLEATMEVEASESRTPPTLRFHKDSAMLIARGTSNQLQVIESVLVTLKRDAENSSDQPSYSMIQATANAEAEVSLARATLEHKNQEVEAIRARLDKLSKMQDAGAVSDAEKNQVREELLKANYEVEKARIQLNLAEQMLDAMKKTGTPPAKRPPLPGSRPNPNQPTGKPSQPAPGK